MPVRICQTKVISIIGIVGVLLAALAITATYAQGPVSGPLVQGGITASGDTIKF